MNENIFENLNNKSAYWLGFIAADGYIYKDYLLGAALAKKDECHLIKMKGFLHSNNNITSDKNAKIFRITNRKIVQDLKNLGIENRKSQSKKSLIRKVPYNYKTSFICGYFDGDGTVFTYKSNGFKHARVGIVGNKNTMSDIIEYLKKFNFRKLKVTKHPPIWRIDWGSKHDIQEFYNFYRFSPFHLDRKYEKFQEVLEILKTIKGRKIVFTL